MALPTTSARKLPLGKLFYALIATAALNVEAAELKLAGIFDHRLVLQREMPVPVWGTANPGEEVTAEINGQTLSATADPNGRWKLTLAPMKASAQAVPFKVSAGGRSVSLDDVLIGEVWFAAGQSNMTMPVKESQNAAAELSSGSREVREYTVMQRLPYANPRETTERTGSWALASTGKLGEFSATAYYFARALHQRLQVPVGIIHASAGGIAAETLTPPAAVSDIPALRHLLEERGIGYGKDVSEAEWNRRKRALEDFWKVMESPETNDQDWERVEVLATEQKVRWATWFRCQFTVDESWANKAAVVRLTKVAGVGRAAFNGKRIKGGSGIDLLEYKLAPGDVKPGVNTLAFRINGYARNQTTADACKLLVADHPEIEAARPPYLARKAETEAVAPPENLSLLGNLFNGMVAPIIPYQIRGVLWYQGEANVPRAREYRTLFPALIAGWRKAWGKPDLPFCFVQLAGFMEVPAQPSETSDWAELREAQAEAAKIEGTAMAVALDLGEAKQIHPRNKQEVGRRLAVAALAKVYQMKEVVGSGPVYASHTVSGDKLQITFENCGGGLLLSTGDTLKGFALGEKNGGFVWADARIVNANTVELSAPGLRAPSRVLYNWSANANGNLMNQARLPVAPFRLGF